MLMMLIVPSMVGDWKIGSRYKTIIRNDKQNKTKQKTFTLYLVFVNKIKTNRH